MNFTCHNYFPIVEDKEKSSEEDSKEKSSSSAPSKRPRDEGRSRADPSKAPDPEEAEKFDESEFQSEACGGFTLPEDKDVVTLDPCEWAWLEGVVRQFFPFFMCR